MASVFANGDHLSHAIFTRIYDNSPYWSLLITPAGLALAIWLMRHYFPGSAGGGIPQSIAALEGGMQALRERILTIRAAIGKMLLTLIGISSGATFGYEGPIVQVGAAIKYSLNRHAALRHEARRAASSWPAAPPAWPPPSTRRWPASCSPSRKWAAPSICAPAPPSCFP